VWLCRRSATRLMRLAGRWSLPSGFETGNGVLTRPQSAVFEEYARRQRGRVGSGKREVRERKERGVAVGSPDFPHSLSPLLPTRQLPLMPPRSRPTSRAKHHDRCIRRVVAGVAQRMGAWNDQARSIAGMQSPVRTLYVLKNLGGMRETGLRTFCTLNSCQRCPRQMRAGQAQRQ